MFDFLKYNKDDSLIRDGIILFSATMIANVLGYLYHFAAGRLLGPADYGILGAVISLLYFINVPVNVIQTTITKFTAQYKAEGKQEKIHALFKTSLRYMLVAGIVGIIFFFVIHFFLADFLHIPNSSLLLFSPIIIFALLMPVSRGILQGSQSFKSLGINLSLEGLVKVGLGVGLIFLGLGVNGAILGIVASFFFAFLFTYFPLKHYFKKTQETLSFKEIYAYAFPVFLALFLLTAFYSLDIMLVKHFLSEQEAGYYAALSLIGKMIFFGTFAIGNVMFPKVAEMHSLQKENKQLLNKSLALMALGSAAAVGIYFLFPTLIVTILFGKEFLSITPYVGWIGIFMAFFSLSYLLSLYNLSIHRTRFIWILAFFIILEIIAILLYHETIGQIVKNLAGIMTALFLSLYLYTRSK